MSTKNGLLMGKKSPLKASYLFPYWVITCTTLKRRNYEKSLEEEKRNNKSLNFFKLDNRYLNTALKHWTNWYTETLQQDNHGRNSLCYLGNRCAYLCLHVDYLTISDTSQMVPPTFLMKNLYTIWLLFFHKNIKIAYSEESIYFAYHLRMYLKVC